MKPGSPEKLNNLSSYQLSLSNRKSSSVRPKSSHISKMKISDAQQKNILYGDQSTTQTRISSIEDNMRLMHGASLKFSTYYQDNLAKSIAQPEPVNVSMSEKMKQSLRRIRSSFSQSNSQNKCARMNLYGGSGSRARNPRYNTSSERGSICNVSNSKSTCLSQMLQLCRDSSQAKKTRVKNSYCSIEESYVESNNQNSSLRQDQIMSEMSTIANSTKNKQSLNQSSYFHSMQHSRKQTL